MSYPISAPVDFSAPGPIDLTLTNTVGTLIWSITTNLAEDIVIGTDATPDILHIYPSGDVEADRFRLRRGGNTVTLDTDPLLASSYSYPLPANPPTGDGQIIGSSGTSNLFFDFSPQSTVTVRKNPGPGEFSSIVAALASIPVSPNPGYPTDTNRWCVYVNAGDYAETQIVIPEFVFIVGISMQSVRLMPAALGYPLITFSIMTGIAFLTIIDTDPAFPALYFYNSGDYALIHKIEMEGCAKGILVETDSLATDISLVYLEYVGTTFCFDYTLTAIDTNILGGFGSEVSIENFFTYDHNDTAIVIDGPNTQLVSQATVCQSDGTGVAITILNGARADLRAVYLESWTTGISVPISTGTPKLLAAGILYEDCDTNIDIQHTTTVGHNDGYTEYTKTQIPKIAPFFISNTDQHIITVASKGADFTSVATALAAITDNSPIHRYTIYVGPGIYPEPQLVMKQYVAIVGFFQTQCILAAINPAVPFIVGAGYAALDKLTITVANPLAPPPYLIEFLGNPSGTHFRVENVIFDTTDRVAHVGSTGGPTIFLVMNSVISMTGALTKGFMIDDAGPSNFPVVYLIDDLIWSPTPAGLASFTELINLTSFKSPAGGFPNVFGAISGCAVGQHNLQVGTCLTMQGAVYSTVESNIMGGYQTGISIPAAAEPTLLLCTSTTLAYNVMDIDIQSTIASGSLNINATIDKVSIASPLFGVTINDSGGSIAISGQIYQGSKWDFITNISEQIQHGSLTGSTAQQPTLTDIGGLNISVAGGTGYVFIDPPPDAHLLYVVWAPVASLPLIDNALNWIYVDSTGLVSTSIATPDYIENIILGSVKTAGGDITYIQRTGRSIHHLASNIDEVLRSVFGPIVKSGCIASPGSSLVERAVAVSSGNYWLSTTSYPPISGDNVSMIGYYDSAQTAPFTNIPLDYSNAGVLTPIPAGMWVKHALYILSDLVGGTQYFFVYGQQLFATELDADDGPLPTPPTFFVGNMCQVAGVVVTDSDPSSPLANTRFRDIRPTLAFTSSGVTASADHNSLTNLTVGDAHPQYFRTDGTRTMTGPVMLGTQNIVGAGGNLLNGIDITLHGSRHAPGGADPIPTGVPVSIGTANATGAAASLARSDHVHDHGAQTVPTLHAVATSLANGFMLAADKVKVDGATELDVPSTLMLRDANGMTQISELQLLSNSSAFYLSLKPSPLGFGGPNHNIDIPVPITNDTVALLNTQQSLTNKILADNTVHFYDDLDPTKMARFELAAISPATIRVFSLPDANTTLVGIDVSQTLTNKTIIGATNVVAASQLRTTGADVVVSGAAPPTVGQVLTATSATAATWQANPSGTVTSVDLSMPAEFSVSGNPVTTSGTLTVTKATQTANTVYAGPTAGVAAPVFRALVAGDLIAAPQVLTVSTVALSVSNGAPVTTAYIPWRNARYSAYTTRTVTAWVTPSATVGKNLTIDVLNNGGASLGSIVVLGGAAVGAIYTFTFTAPGADTRLDFVVSRTGGVGANPLINGITVEFA